jgi:hypothetical protein
MSCSPSVAPRGLGKVQEQAEQLKRFSAGVCSHTRVLLSPGIAESVLCIRLLTVPGAPCAGVARGDVSCGCPMRRCCAWGCFLRVPHAPVLRVGMFLAGAPCAGLARRDVPPAACNNPAQSLEFETRLSNRCVRNRYSSVHIDENVIIIYGRVLPFPLEIAAVSSAGL